MSNNHIILPYSEQSGHKPDSDRIKVGELWINGSDFVLGTKTQSGDVVAFAQLTENQKQQLLQTIGDYIPNEGIASNVTVSYQPTVVQSPEIVIDDDSTNTIHYTVQSDNEQVNINIANTTGTKAGYVTITKPAGLHCTLNWAGVDQWLSTQYEPSFGESDEVQHIGFAVFTDSTTRCVNVMYNTESPQDLAIDSWGMIGGDIESQTDLWDILSSKANASDVATGYCTLGQYNALKNQVDELTNQVNELKLIVEQLQSGN